MTAIDKLHTQAPGLFNADRLPELSFINAPGEDTLLNPVSGHIAPAWAYDSEAHPRPSDSVVANLQQIKAFLHDFAPVTCILHAIACIINPAICIQQRSVVHQLHTLFVEHRSVASQILPLWGLPFPGLQLSSNSGVSRDDIPDGEGCDWSMEAHIGDFQGGHVVYPQRRVTLPSPPGAITARMSRVWVHEVPPVCGNRWMLSMSHNPVLTKCLKLQGVEPVTVEELETGKNAPDDAIQKKLLSPHYTVNKMAG